MHQGLKESLFNVRITRDEASDSETFLVGNLRFRLGTWGSPLTYVLICKMRICCVAIWSQEGGYVKRLTEYANFKWKAIAIINHQTVYIEHLRCNCNHGPFFFLLMNEYSEEEIQWVYDFDNFLFLKIEFSLTISIFFQPYFGSQFFVCLFVFCLHVEICE